MKNKKWVVLMIVGMLAIILAACGGENPETASKSASDVSTSEDGDPSTEGAESERPALMQAAQIPIGTLLLEGTEFAVEPDQAAELLPLWKAYRSLVESNTASSLEIDAVLGQIENTMTADQLQTITEMDLAPENMRDMMEELGLAPEEARTGNGATEGFSRPGGGIGGGPGAGGPGGGQGGDFGADLSQEQIATLQADREKIGAGQNQFAIVFVEALVEFLEAK